MEFAEAEALSREMIAAWNEGGMAGLEPFLAEDTVVHSPPEVPGGGRFEGREALEFIGGWAPGGGGVQLRMELGELIEASDGRWLITIEATHTGDSSGIALGRQSWYHLVRIRDRKLCHDRMFLDRDQALRAAGLGPG